MSVCDNSGNAIVQNTYGIAPLVSLSNVSATGAGAALDGLVIRTTAVMVVTSSAGVSAGAVQAQTSLDGVNWANAGSSVSTSTASTVFAPVVVTGAFRYVRANVTTAITGGTISATVGLTG
ncbi:hypothetical protein [Mycobacterium kansasii]|uniref:hypothetical protein n=1 Tax=Mycobacterium kansasii TaxID=1768 RepID=UPI00115C2E99|nr:hypothetical protein [Mycobacterium kansasii]